MLPNQSQRVVAHVDLDAFYTQVEVQRNPQLKGLPVVTVQYNPFGDLRTIAPDEPRVFNDSNGSLIAVSYEARSFGVKRGMRGDQARKVCPEVQLVQVPTAHGKADLTLYRDAGKQVVDILSRIGVVERASIDECYLDLTEEAHTRLAACNGQPILPVNPDRVHICGQEGEHAVGNWWKRSPELWQSGELLLACGATAVADLRAAVAAELDYSCSAGIAHNKILAKLASGMHKPSQQTLVSMAAIPGLLQDLPIPKLRQLGGKFGDELMSMLNIKTVGELAEVSLQALQSQFGDSTAQWLYRLARGCDTEEVKQRTLPKSISCGKTFRNHTALHTIDEVRHWLQELGKELEERVAEDRKANARLPQLLTVSFYTPPEGQGPASGQGKVQPGVGPGQGKWVQEGWQGGTSMSRSCQLRKATASCMGDDATSLVKKWTVTQKGWAIWSMFMAVSNFAAAPTGGSLITKFFKQPGSLAQTQHKEEPGTQEQLTLRLGQSANALVAEGLHATDEPPHPGAAADQDKHASEGKQSCQVARQVQVKDHHASTDIRSLLVHRPMLLSSSSPASFPSIVGSLPESAQALPPLSCTGAPQLSAGNSDAGLTSAALALQSHPSDPPQKGAVTAKPHVSNNSAQILSPSPAAPGAAATAAGSHDSSHAGTTSVASSRGEDSSGAANHPVEAPAGESKSFNRFPQVQGLADKGSVKRPLEQAFSKEPEHRKKPTRTQQSGGVDAPLSLNYTKDSIDEAVLSELPAAMQREIRLSMMSQRSAINKQSQHKGNAKAGLHKFLKPRT